VGGGWGSVLREWVWVGLLEVVMMREGGDCMDMEGEVGFKYIWEKSF
jgi:hypothetical protein